ncbi:putative DNA-directed RNA polymerase V subunit 5A [Iris pallida]|uniref:DNA-directed RNA polymerase V subunit 5A n=1 Tax=Iris pallida TaxID=29817 RepID=A0AAX6H4V1_IRIPA|nr:putative DNA-directed RNA polymerase V subunit 5A [Iris pallida]
MSLADFRRTFSQTPDLDRLRISSTFLKDPSKKILGIFWGVNQVKLKDMPEIRKQFANERLSRMIVVLQGSLATQTHKKLKDLFPFKVETFQITDLLVNITKHVLKPKHEILSEEEKQKLLNKYIVEDR